MANILELAQVDEKFMIQPNHLKRAAEICLDVTFLRGSCIVILPQPGLADVDARAQAR
ncbi:MULTISPECIES: hypothetical protein [Bradyrhizobium]|uniref:Uncharacterized protein n=1 Tax=Bradyrhizobium brasilense TaxID=1419277 RepID=A0ABY8JLN0_9BRAD|nr:MULTISPECIES: hypothetical protein [Bradyrhizobium]MCC8951385.1 hypothetical protein [Bradyrhizobium brasilense]MCP1829789.1 hypothetical protein [Bradyrhizobium sp. USDA 4545]MCP1922898.1 hypothetical protein [Bradyrhizobium sp. USDA 4532]WFU64948.1 hypothetical protein QA636_05220 [Bradyrhizobium brasilense]